MGKRDAAILDILTKEKKIEVSSLAATLGVSNVTMRKDLDALEAKGVIQREHGYALLGNPDDINGRLAFHYETKVAIAKKAAELVTNGDTIMIESGSCCALLAKVVVETKRDVTIVTNSAFIAAYVRENPNANCILLGGSYQNDAQVLVGPMVRACAESFLVERLFIGADGWIDEGGFTNSDHLRAEAVRDMAAQAEGVVVLTESDKFGRRGVVPLRLGKKPLTVITDDALDVTGRKALVSHGVKLLEVPQQG
ncbi:MAG: DeoR/GlpR family DNA-binding transcription regulator [Atopobiaceae bacterium]|jgi:DeoR/GlpR family transcriptional regulator of sugar metabolism|nr:DeoR/GlpR family DNA-binding transcription regulator [Atopobiaceae bacterium]